MCLLVLVLRCDLPVFDHMTRADFVSKYAGKQGFILRGAAITDDKVRRICTRPYLLYLPICMCVRARMQAFVWGRDYMVRKYAQVNS